jgi:hypothetical protein
MMPMPVTMNWFREAHFWPTLPISFTTSTGRLTGAALATWTKRNILNALTPIEPV